MNVRRNLLPIYFLVATFAAGALSAAVSDATSPTLPTMEVTSRPTPQLSGISDAGGEKVPPHKRAVTFEMSLRAILILLLFIVIAVSIAMRKLPALIALPLMAFGIGVIAGIPLMGRDGVLASIIEGRTTPSPSGAFQLYKAIIYVLIGGMFARFISDAKIAERLVKYTAEFGGEDPFFIALMMSAVTALIFTAVGGLPAIIMLGTVMFPVLLSLGVPPVICGSLLMLAFPIGASLSPTGWVTTAEIFKVRFEDARNFYLTWAGVQILVLLFFLSFEFLRMKRTTVTPRRVVISLMQLVAIATVIGAIAFVDDLGRMLSLPHSAIELLMNTRSGVWQALRWAVGILIGFGVVKTQWDVWRGKKSISHWNLLTPVLPLVFLLVLGFDNQSSEVSASGQTIKRSDPAIIPAFFASLAYAFFTTPRARGIQKLAKSVMDGIADVAAPAALMLGIGMLVAAAQHPRVGDVLLPILARVVPTSATSYVLFFLLASPLSLYRGPLNAYGLGAGIAALLREFIPAAATMGAIESVGKLVDPTTTQNVWICGYLKLDINALLFKLFFYGLAMCIIGLLVSAYMFF